MPHGPTPKLPQSGDHADLINRCTEIVGGPVALARQLGVRYCSVHDWRIGRHNPRSRHVEAMRGIVGE